MALPTTIDPSSPTGSSSPSLGDDQLRALKLAITDILGIGVDPISIAAAAFSILASGLQSANFQNTAANPATAGFLQRNGANLKFHDGTVVQELAFISDLPVSVVTNFSDLVGTIALAQITNDLITYAKIQNISAATKLLGRGGASGSGDVEELALGSGLSMAATTLSVLNPVPTAPAVATHAVSINTGKTTNSLSRLYVAANTANAITVRITVVGYSGGTGGKGGSPTSMATVNTDYTTTHNVGRIQNVTPSLVITSLANPFTGTLTLHYS